ncbi:MAG: hypothetical protein ACK4QL_00845 [Pseudanabaenaceae cyanobacterium]
MDKLLFWINKILLVDVLLVFLFFIWFVVATIADLMHMNLGLPIWQSLWTPVIQPAIGLVMLGAIVVGISGRVKRK